MTTSSPELILHQYDFSNYAEKARLALGYKRLAWCAVTIPAVAPKPDLTPLTGGYRRTPVLQVGADIYCDTHLILRVLQRRQPAPVIGFTAAAEAIAYWAERSLFRPMSLYVSGSNLDVLPKDLQADRSRMRGLPVPDDETVRRAAKRNAPAVRVQIARVEDMLGDGRDWLCGPAVTVADFAVHHALWFLTARTERLAHELAPHPRIRAWMARMRAFGHGEVSPMTSGEALDVAAAAEPAPPRASERFEEDPPLGRLVRIRAEDYARDPVEGELVAIDRDEIALRREDPRVGEVVVHFPRLGYDLRPTR
ncbi:MAG: glutathione S-transferase family protein [Alphaproteobacteria bacterium]